MDSVMGLRVTQVLLEGIFIGVTTVAVVENTNTHNFWWCNKMEGYALLM